MKMIISTLACVTLLSGISALADEAKVQAAYAKDVKEILLKKCGNCHGTGEKSPEYSANAEVKSLVDMVHEKAKKEVELGDTVKPGPKMQGSLKKAVKEIAEMAEKAKMPPKKYVQLVPGSALTPEEKEAIAKWAKENSLDK